MGAYKMSNVQKVKIGTKKWVDANCDNCGKRFKYLKKVEYGCQWEAWFCERCVGWFEPKENMAIVPYQPEMEIK